MFDLKLLEKRKNKSIKDAGFFFDPIEQSFHERSHILKNPPGALSFMELHWVWDVQTFFKSIHDKLNSGEAFQGCFVGGESLNDIKFFFMETELEVCGKVAARFSPMILEVSLIKLLNLARFYDIIVDKEVYVFEYTSFDRMIQDLRASGQTNALIGGETYFPRALYFELKKRFDEKPIVAEFDIIYWSCFKK